MDEGTGGGDVAASGSTPPPADESGEEELLALWSWLRSFPQLSSLGDSSVPTRGRGHNPEERRAIHVDVVRKWLDDENVARGVLAAAEEICGEAAPTSATIHDDDAPNGSGCERPPTDIEIWDLVSKLAGVERRADPARPGNDTGSESSTRGDPTESGATRAASCSNEAEGSDWRSPALCALLCRAVSDGTARRQEYISRILALNDAAADADGDGSFFASDVGVGVDVQKVLMKIIERGMTEDNGGEKTQRGEPDCGDVEPDVDASDLGNSKLDGGQRDGSGDCADSLTRSSDEAGLPRTGYTPIRKRHVHGNIEARCDVGMVDADDCSDGDGIVDQRRLDNGVIKDLERDIQCLREENEQCREREGAINEAMEEIQAKYRSQALKEEAKSLDREAKMREEYDAEVARLEVELKKSLEQNVEAERIKDQLAALKDEVDLLHHSEKKLQQTEEHLRKCKTRLAELNDVKDQLSREEEAHGTAVAKILELENELKQLQPLQKQLETYRTRSTNAEVKLAECQHDLEKLRKERRDLSDANAELSDVSKFQVDQAERLRQQLVEEAGTAEDTEVNGLGEGMSELNPALKEEILRLRNENARLREFAEKRTDDAVVRLEETLSDTQRLADSFRDQFLSTKTKLEEAEGNIQSLTHEIANLKESVSSWTDKANGLEVELEAERCRGTEAQKAATAKLEGLKKALLAKSQSDMQRLEKHYTGMLETERVESRSKLDEAANELCRTKENARIEISNTRKESEARLEEQKNDSLRLHEETKDAHAKAIDDLRATAERERQELIAKGKAMLKAKREEHEDKMKDFSEMHDQAISDMKDELSNYREKQAEYEEKAKGKIAGYKYKLNVANGKASALENEIDDLHQIRKRLEQDKTKALEENERFRKQVGSRFGAESNLEAQFNTLQREYNLVLEENRALKRKTLDFSRVSQPVATDFDESPDYRTPAVSGGTLSQLRSEYEDTIQKLHDEKRELVMKNSAAVSDMQKAEQRSWQLDQELSTLKGELTSTQLLVQRLERQVQQTQQKTHSTSPSTSFNSERHQTPLSTLKLSTEASLQSQQKKKIKDSSATDAQKENTPPRSSYRRKQTLEQGKRKTDLFSPPMTSSSENVSFRREKECAEPMLQNSMILPSPKKSLLQNAHGDRKKTQKGPALALSVRKKHGPKKIVPSLMECTQPGKGRATDGAQECQQS